MILIWRIIFLNIKYNIVNIISIIFKFIFLNLVLFNNNKKFCKNMEYLFLDLRI